MNRGSLYRKYLIIFYESGSYYFFSSTRGSIVHTNKYKIYYNNYLYEYYFYGCERILYLIISCNSNLMLFCNSLRDFHRTKKILENYINYILKSHITA
jgi:hypothetical protein